jgi:endoglucanase
MQPREERNKNAVKIEDLWVDIGARSKQEAEELAPIGTPIQVGDEFIELRNGRFAGRIDNRFGCFVIAEVMRQLAAEKDQLFPTVHAAATVQEETSIGFTGAAAVAYRLAPTAAIAIDVNQSVDTPGADKRQHGDAKLGAGPILNVGVMTSNKLAEAIKQAASGAGIPIQLEYNNARTFTDADALPGLRTGIPAVYFGNPLRYMHSSFELAEWRDIEQTIDVLVAYIRSIESEVDYTP